LYLREQLARFEHQITDCNAIAMATIVVELDLTPVVFERGEQRDGRRIAELGERLDGGTNDICVCMLEKSTKKLHAPWLGHLGEQKWQLDQCGARRWQPIERALDAKGNFFEAIESEHLECFACRNPRLRKMAAENVDKQINDCVAVEIAQDERETREAERSFGVVRESKCAFRCARDLGYELGAAMLEQRSVQSANVAFFIEQQSELVMNRWHCAASIAR